MDLLVADVDDDHVGLDRADLAGDDVRRRREPLQAARPASPAARPRGPRAAAGPAGGAARAAARSPARRRRRRSARPARRRPARRPRCSARATRAPPAPARSRCSPRGGSRRRRARRSTPAAPGRCPGRSGTRRARRRPSRASAARRGHVDAVAVDVAPDPRAVQEGQVDHREQHDHDDGAAPAAARSAAQPGHARQPSSPGTNAISSSGRRTRGRVSRSRSRSGTSAGSPRTPIATPVISRTWSGTPRAARRRGLVEPGELVGVQPHGHRLQGHVGRRPGRGRSARCRGP